MIQVQIAFSDIGPDDGPSQYVLGSHYSGRDRALLHKQSCLHIPVLLRMQPVLMVQPCRQA